MIGYPHVWFVYYLAVSFSLCTCWCVVCVDGACCCFGVVWICLGFGFLASVGDCVFVVYVVDIISVCAAWFGVNSVVLFLLLLDMLWFFVSIVMLVGLIYCGFGMVDGLILLFVGAFCCLGLCSCGWVVLFGWV